MTRRCLALALVALMAIPATTTAASLTPRRIPATDFAPGVVLVDFKHAAGKSERAHVRAAVHAKAHDRVSPLADDLERLTLPEGTTVEQAVRTLQRDPSVRFAQPDYVLKIDAIPNDPGYESTELWGMYGPSTAPPAIYGSNAAGAWEDGWFGSRSVVVGILDTGVDISHPELAPNIWNNPFETANGVDDDGNGYVDDLHGWDFINDDASVYDGEIDYHGTHVAGTIGAAGGNDEGVIGVNWAVTMIPAKFIQGEGFSSDAIAALDYLTDLKARHGLNIVATNNSYGGDEFDQAFLDAINRGGDADILYVAAAGNSGVDTDLNPVYPQSYECDTRYDTDEPRGYDCVVSVAALDVNGFKPSFSNYGATSVDLGAPGADIISTYPGNLYASINGTSMAAPHVTGSLALLAACQAAPTPSALRETLLSTAVATTSMSGITVTGGRLDTGAMSADCDAAATPRATLAAPVGPYVTGTSTAYTLWLSGSVTDFAAADLTLGGTSTGWSIGTITGSAAGPYRIPLSGSNPADGTLTLALKASSVTIAAVTGPAVAEAAPTVVVDRRAPVVGGLSVKAAVGATATCSGVPLRLTWTGNDFGGSGIARYELAQSINGGAFTTISSSLASPSATITVASTGNRKFRVRAIDASGKVGTWLTGALVTPRLTQQTSTSIVYSPTGWTTTSSSVYCGSSVKRASVLGKTATFSFTGRAVALVTTVAPNRGKVKVYVDGVFVTTLDLFSASTAYKRVAWERTWATAGAHKVKLVVQGTLNRPRIDLDAFIVLK